MLKHSLFRTHSASQAAADKENPGGTNIKASCWIWGLGNTVWISWPSPTQETQGAALQPSTWRFSPPTHNTYGHHHSGAWYPHMTQFFASSIDQHLHPKGDWVTIPFTEEGRERSARGLLLRNPKHQQIITVCPKQKWGLKAGLARGSWATLLYLTHRRVPRILYYSSPKLKL